MGDFPKSYVALFEKLFHIHDYRRVAIANIDTTYNSLLRVAIPKLGTVTIGIVEIINHLSS